jgi:multidrug efflux pump subunit AcrA (membrane-fusion protein)
MLAAALFPALLLASCAKKEPPPPPGPPAVKVAEVVLTEVPDILEAIGQTRGSQEVEIRARVEGYLATVDFAEGSLVNEGDKLFTIDPKPFEAQNS